MTNQPVRFETLIERHHDEIYSYLWRLLRDADDAQDLTQQVFMRAYQAFERLRPNSNYRAWLYKIATNCAYTALKQNKQHAERTLPLVDDLRADDNCAPAEHDETMQAVRQAIADLPARQQQAVLLRHVQGLEYNEIAAILHCSEDSARANVYQAIRRLRQELSGVKQDRLATCSTADRRTK